VKEISGVINEMKKPKKTRRRRRASAKNERRKLRKINIGAAIKPAKCRVWHQQRDFGMHSALQTEETELGRQ